MPSFDSQKIVKIFVAKRIDYVKLKEYTVATKRNKGRWKNESKKVRWT